MAGVEEHGSRALSGCKDVPGPAEGEIQTSLHQVHQFGFIGASVGLKPAGSNRNLEVRSVKLHFLLQ